LILLQVAMVALLPPCSQKIINSFYLFNYSTFEIALSKSFRNFVVETNYLVFEVV